MNDYQLVVVMAGNKREAEQWRREEGLSPREWIYPSSPRMLDGARPTRVVVLPGFARHPRPYYAQRVELTMQYILRKSKDPIEIEYL